MTSLSAWCGHGPDSRGPVQILSRDRAGGAAVAFGTGYRVQPDLVLTAEHVVPVLGDGDPRVTVWRKGKEPLESRDATVVWRGLEFGLDLVLLQVEGARNWPPVAGAAWGRIDRDSALGPAHFRFLGYPRANEIDEEWNLDDRIGTIPLQTFAEADLFACEVTGAAPVRIGDQTMWAGASGSAVFADGLLVGVVTDDPVRVEASRLIAVPLHHALTDERFGELARVNPSGPIAVRPTADHTDDPIEVALWADDTVQRTWVLGLKQAFELNGIGVRLIEDELPDAELLRWNRLAPDADRYLAVVTGAGSPQATEYYKRAKLLLGQRDDLQLAVLARDGVVLDGIESRHVVRYGGGDESQAVAAAVAVQLHAGLYAGHVERPSLPRKPSIHRGYKWLGNFVGRRQERHELSEWLEREGEALYVLQAMGGTGKSALAWVWLMGDVLGELKGGDVDAALTPEHVPRLDGVAWFSFYGADSTSSYFFDWLLRELDAQPDGDADQVDAVLDLLRERRLVVVMDGLERELRAYQSLAAARLGERFSEADTDFDLRSAVNPALTRFLQGLFDPTIDSKVLVTTRLLPSDLDDPAGILGGFRYRQLSDFGPQDVVQLYRGFHIVGTDEEIIAACRPYGFHPLTVRLLAGMIVKSLKDRGNIRAAPRYDPVEVGDQRTRVLADSYDSLLPSEAKILGRLAACRASVRFDFAHRISGIESESEFEDALAGLLGRGLVMMEPDASRFDLHPIVRHYAYGRLVDRQGLHREIAGELEEDLEDFDLEDEDLPQDQFLARKDDLLEFFHQLVSLGALQDAASLFHEGLRAHLERAGEFQDAIACLDLLLADETRLDEEFDDPDQRYMLRMAMAGLALRLGEADLAIDHVDAEFRHPSWNEDPLPDNDLVGQPAGRAMLEQIRTGALWFLGRVSEAKADLVSAIEALSANPDDAVLAIGPRAILIGYHTADGEFLAVRELTKVSIDAFNGLISEALADLAEGEETPDEVAGLRRLVELQEASLELLPDRDLADFRMEDRTKLAKVFELYRSLLEEQLQEPMLAADIRQSLELQLVMLRLSELQLGISTSPDESAVVEGQLRELLASARSSSLVLQEVTALLGLGAVLLERGNVHQAVERAEEAIAISDARRLCSGSVGGRIALAQAAIRSDDEETAQNWEAEARRLATEGGELHFGIQFQGIRQVRERARAQRGHRDGPSQPMPGITFSSRSG
jgi:tetratricopeptide (TPR) repeat protein